MGLRQLWAEIAASRTRIVEAQDEERRRIERDIHDGVQQELASLIGKLRLALNQLERSPADASATIASAQDDVRRTLADVRAIAQGIHPAILDDQGIARAIDAREKRLPGLFYDRPTLMFNGYGDQVASLYTGMDLRKFY